MWIKKKTPKEPQMRAQKVRKWNKVKLIKVNIVGLWEDEDEFFFADSGFAKRIAKGLLGSVERDVYVERGRMKNVC